MNDEFIRDPAWLEPLLPSSLPDALLNKAERLVYAAGKLDGSVAPDTSARLVRLLRITNSYYSNLIEGQYTEPAALEASRPATAPRRPESALRALAEHHVKVQAGLDRSLGRLAWQDGFAPGLLERVHQHLFRDCDESELQLKDGQGMVPGQLRSEAALEVQVGQHLAPHSSAVRPMLERMQVAYGRIGDSRHRLMAALAYHHRLAWVHPFPDGNGRVVRLLTHVHLKQIGLGSGLWSLSRGLARHRATYYARLANADRPRHGALDGRGQLSQRMLVEFMDFMLDTCLDQVGYMQQALSMDGMRPQLDRLLAFHPRFSQAGVRPDAARALHVLIQLGRLPRADFKALLGVGERLATDQLQRLVRLGVVESPSPKAREIHPGLPVWFAQELFPELHRRFD